MINEVFSEGHSVIHRLDPRIRIVFCTLFSFLTALSAEFQSLYGALGVSMIILVAARLSPGQVLKRLKVVLGFLILLWMLLPLTYEGEMIATLGPLVFTRPGVLLAGAISLKSIAILLAFIALFSTMTFAQLGHGLARMGCPGKLVHHLLMTYRYIFVIDEEYQRLLRAVKMRNFRPKTTIHTYRTYAYLVGMLFVRASERANQVHRAMLCRGFNGRFHCLGEFPATGWNWGFSVAMAVTMTGLVFLEQGIYPWY